MENENGLPAEIDDLLTEDDDQDKPPDLESQLSQFRADWQKEISDLQPSSNESSARDSPVSGLFCQNEAIREAQLASLSKEDQAKTLFIDGIKAEQKGYVLEAVELYRRAIQLVPDVESMIDYRASISRERQESESSVEGCVMEMDDEDLDLILKFQRLQTETQAICRPDWEQRRKHISSLPVEVLIYIFKWVITNDLDMLALEKLATVCRGFYLCARDEELWRLACVKIWGVNTGKCKKYGGWRNMFIERPHLRYNGCYISKSSYVRAGERSVDNLYRAWHTVEYYRYVRFFPEGILLIMTSPEDPVTTLHKLKHRSCKRPGTLEGVYRMKGGKVTAVLRRVKTEWPTSAYTRFKRRQQNANQNEPERSFHAEFEVVSAGKKTCAQLIWTHYSVRQIRRSTGEETVAEFDLNNKSYPPLYFSRVKSYTASADGPLQ